MLIEQTVATVAERVASGATYGGGLVAFIGGVSANWVAAIGGLLIGAVGLWMKWYFGQQHLKLARERQAAVQEGGDE